MSNSRLLSAPTITHKAMAVSFGIERRSSGRTMSPRSLGSVLVDRMASFRSVDRSVPPAVTPSNPDEILNEARRCLSERFHFVCFPSSFFFFLPVLFSIGRYSHWRRSQCDVDDVLTTALGDGSSARPCGGAAMRVTFFFSLFPFFLFFFSWFVWLSSNKAWWHA